MNPSRSVIARNLFALSLGLALFVGPSGTRAQDEIDCRPVIEQFRQNVQKAPTHVLTLLEDALIANGGHCVPQFVQAAIEASAADAKTVKKIVFVAITNAQAQAPQIAESAVSASPQHADAVREAFAEAFDADNPRLKPAEPADQPAWAQENSPVPEPTPPTIAPKTKPTPAPAPKPTPTPTPAPQTGPVIAQAPTQTTALPDEGWALLHDGVVEQSSPSDPAALAGTASPSPASPAPAAVEPELPDMKKKFFGFALPSLPSLPKLPQLPEVTEPTDLFFHEPFGGVPSFDQGS